jgi:D-alanyl-D-alanine carboxypeptidase
MILPINFWYHAPYSTFTINTVQLNKYITSPGSFRNYLLQKKFWEEIDRRPSKPKTPEPTTPPQPVDTQTAQALQNTLDQVLDDTVGASAAVVGDKAWYGASGLANIRTNTPVKPEDRFQIGSITKTFVATTVLQLAEEGKLSLEDTIDKHLPDEIISLLPDNDITVRQLLNHTSGIADYLRPLLDFGINLFREWQPEDLIELVAGKPLSFDPGASWFYSNTNYILLGQIVENVTGRSIASEVRTRILEPLKLDNTFFADTEEVPGGFVSGYWDIDNDGDLNDVSSFNLTIFGSSGSIVSNNEDLADFGKGLFEGILLKPASLNQMLTFEEATGSRTFSGYGLGVARLKTSDGELIYGHNGLTLGYRANMWYVPDSELIYVDLQNSRTIDNYIEPILTTWEQYQSNSNSLIPSSTPNNLALNFDANFAQSYINPVI